MRPWLRSSIRKSVPKATLRRLVPYWNAFVESRTRSVRRTFEQAPQTPDWLEWPDLERLHQSSPFPPDYRSVSREKRAHERALELLTALPAGNDVSTVLELGCSDALTCAELQRRGKHTTAIDLKGDRFSSDARQAGVRLLAMNAMELEFPDASFDYAFSYNSFEHFSDPGAVLQETIRVVKPGGYLYFNFGPLYMSPYGLHAYAVTPIPYCQFLFPREMLQRFAEQHSLGSIPFDSLNYWSVEQFRQLWQSYAEEVRCLRYVERRESAGSELIACYPSCFRSKTQHYDNLVVASMEILLERR